MSKNSTAKSRNTQLTGAFELFWKSYDIVVRNLKSFVVLLFLPLVVSIVSTVHSQVNTEGITRRLGQFNYYGSAAPASSIISWASGGMLLMFLLVFLVIIIQTMLYGLELEGAQGKTPSFARLLDIARKFWPRVLGITFMIGLYVIVSSILGMIVMLIFKNNVGVAIGTTWMVGAGLFIVQRYLLSPFILIDKDIQILSALEQSAHIAKSNSRAVWSVMGVMLLLGFTGLIPVLGAIISFALGAAYSVAPALRYEELKKLPISN